MKHSKLLMIKIDLSGTVTYFSQLDELAFFTWAGNIKCIRSIDNGFFHIKSKRISKESLLDLIAIMHRYNMPMRQLSVFCNETNEKWFKDKKKYWYKKTFGK
jgi:uncharacterized protein involved in tolerance to divalent cations